MALRPRYNEFHRELLRWSRVSGLAPTATAFNRSRLTSSSSSGLRPYWSAACYLVSHEGATEILRQYWPDAPSLGPSTVIDTRSQNLPVAVHLLLNTTGAYIAAPLLSQPAEGGTHNVGGILKRDSRWNALNTYYPGWNTLNSSLVAIPFSAVAILSAGHPWVRGAVGTGPRRGLVRESPLHALLLAQLPAHLRLTIAPLPPPPPWAPADTVQPRSLAAILRLVANATDSRRAQPDGAPQYTLLLDIDRMVSTFGRGVTAQQASVMMDRLVRLAFVTAANSTLEARVDVALIHYLAATGGFGTVLVPFGPTYEGGRGADHAATVAMLVRTSQIGAVAMAAV